MVSVNSSEVLRIAKLARLKTPTGEKLESMTKVFNQFLNWVEQIESLDLEGVEPMTSPVSGSLLMRQDFVSDGGISDDVLKNAPKSESGFFVVPKSIE